jgi:cupin fold WbuC family metalloprotein
MRWREVGPDVFYSDTSPVLASEADLQFLEGRAQASTRGRARFCAHPSPDDGLHEMLICLARKCYVRPHRHHRPESALIVRGECDLVLFDEQGGIVNVLPLSDPSRGAAFFVRLDEPVYHTYLLRTDFLFFLETTPGPLDRQLTEYAPWAPAEDVSNEAFRQQLRDRVAHQQRGPHA